MTQDTTNINQGGNDNYIGSVATGQNARAVNYSGGGGSPSRDLQELERLLNELDEQIEQHTEEVRQSERARNAIAVLRDEARDPDSNPVLIRGTLERLQSAVEAVSPLVSLAGKVAEAIQPWLR
jgi:hypothetical protein